jgi:hypothetical protein
MIIHYASNPSITHDFAETGHGTRQSQNANIEICGITSKWQLQMHNCAAPPQVWNFGLIYIAEVQSVIAHADQLNALASNQFWDILLTLNGTI